MNKFILYLLIIFLPKANAEDQAETKNSIKEIRQWLASSDASQTCLDEYFQRRRELGIKLGFSPLIIVGSTVVGGYGGSLAGAGIFELSGIPYGGLGNVVAVAIGGIVGSTFGLTLGVSEEAISLVSFLKNQALLHLIYESQTTKGFILKKFYDEFRFYYPHSSLNEDKFMEEVSYLDTLGILCDGTLVKTKRHKKGKKLKQNLATKKEIFEYLSDIK
jgi:hypothetical protein